MSNNRPSLKRTKGEKNLEIPNAKIEAPSQPLAQAASQYGSTSEAIRNPKAPEVTPTPYNAMPTVPKRPLPAASDYQSMPTDTRHSGEIPGFPRNVASTATMQKLLDETPATTSRPPVNYEQLPPEKPNRAVRTPQIELISTANKLAIMAENFIKAHADHNIAYKVLPDAYKIEMTIANKDNTKVVVKEVNLQDEKSLDKHLAKINPEKLKTLYHDLMLKQTAQQKLAQEPTTEESKGSPNSMRRRF